MKEDELIPDINIDEEIRKWQEKEKYGKKLIRSLNKWKLKLENI